MSTVLTGPNFGPVADGAPSQLIILLHGLGADGHDLIGLGPSLGRAAAPGPVRRA